jgi:hypothetical protein
MQFRRNHIILNTKASFSVNIHDVTEKEASSKLCSKFNTLHGNTRIMSVLDNKVSKNGYMENILTSNCITPGATGLPGQPPIQLNQRWESGTGTTTIVPSPCLPCSPLAPSAPVDPVSPVSPFSAGVPGVPCGPAGPGTVTTTGGVGSDAVFCSHALNASADSAAATKIKYFIIILLFILQVLSAILRTAVQSSVVPASY